MWRLSWLAHFQSLASFCLKQHGPDAAWVPSTRFVALNLLSNGPASAVRFATTRQMGKERESRRGYGKVIKKIELR